MKHEVGKPNRKMPLPLERENERRLLRAQYDINMSTGDKVPLSVLINKALRETDWKAFVADFGGGK